MVRMNENKSQTLPRFQKVKIDVDLRGFGTLEIDGHQIKGVQSAIVKASPGGDQLTTIELSMLAESVEVVADCVSVPPGMSATGAARIFRQYRKPPHPLAELASSDEHAPDQAGDAVIGIVGEPVGG